MPTNKQSLKLKSEQLYWQCDPESLGIKTTNDIEPCQEIIGQERALRAIRLGLRIQSHGYNIYVSGLTGTGKTTTVHKLLHQIDSKDKSPEDICYVNNFSDNNSPTYLCFPAGRGKRFSKDMDNTIHSLQKLIPKLFEGDNYKTQSKDITEKLTVKSQALINEFEKRISKEGLIFVQIQEGSVTRPEIMPKINNEVVSFQELSNLVNENKVSEEVHDDLRQKYHVYMEELQDIILAHQEMEKETQEILDDLEQKIAKPTIEKHINTLQRKYTQQRVQDYLNDVMDDILLNLDLFFADEIQINGNSEEDKKVAMMPMEAIQIKDPFLEYKVNVVVDNSKTRSTPIIIETAPTFNNLFGSIEPSWHPSGVMWSDFTSIKAGSILRANGGYLVFNLMEALADDRIWTVLKRTLKNKQMIIQGMENMSGFASSSIKPEPIDIQLKVLVIGDEYTYRMLYDMDDEFKKIFKIRADFDTVMINNRDSIQKYIQFASKIVHDEKLLHLDNKGMARILEHGVCLAGSKNKFSTKFSDIADIIREAHFWSTEENSDIISISHIERAIDERKYRLKTLEEKLLEMIDDGTILLDLDGKKTGQVNGLSVYSLGDYSFGNPSKITAEAAVGKSGIINIEREAGLGGSSYNKGVLIISGYFRGIYAQDKPLTMSASLCFEQSYSGVDGDSASSTEIYALLSALSEIPIRQDIAVTGSVNQKGEIQSIGGVNEKIHGFFDVCKLKGLTGTQGVLIPKTNINELMLRKDVVKAVEEQQFHIWAVETIDEGIEILTDKKAGAKNAKGEFPKGTIHYLTNQKLNEYAQYMKEFLAQGD